MAFLGFVLFMVWGIAVAKTGECECDDSVPDIFSCTQQKEWGKCDEAWMIQLNYCAKTCGRCTCPYLGQEHTLITTSTSTQQDAISKLEQLLSNEQQRHNQPEPENIVNSDNSNDKLDQNILQQSQITMDQPETEDAETSNGGQLDTYQSYLLDQLRYFSEEQMQEKYQNLQVPSAELPYLNLTVQAEDPQNLQATLQVLKNVSSNGNENVVGTQEIKTAAEAISSPSVDVSNPPVPINPPPPVPIISSPPMIKEEAQSLPSVTTDVSPPGVFEATADADPYPIDQQECTPLASILAQTPGLQQFQRLLRLVDYSIDDHPEKITLFAPIDQGIAKFLRAYDLKINDLDILPEDELKTLRSKFQPFVKYHFVDQKIKSDAVEKLKQIRLETHFDENLLYLRDLKEWSRYPFELIDGQGDKCKVMIADLEACEGVVHMVACMLRPDI